MIRHFLFLLLWHGCLCVPGRPSKWHGKLSSSTGATLTAACGQVTTAKNNPWAAILYANNVFQCGATILENQLAITAAHCVLGVHTDDLSLFYGRTFQPDSGIEDRGFDRFGGQTGILAVRIHPNYNTFDQFEGNDIAVLKLVRRIRFNDFVKPIRVVPTHHKYDTLYDRANVVRTASFGQTKGHINSDNPDDWPDQMQEVEHRIVPEQRCNRGNDTFHFGPPRDGVCTRGRCRRKDNPGIQANYKQICPGDSGSGIVRLFQEENQYYLLAVVSYTVTHDEKVCGLSSLPSLSINTRDHRDFIYEDIFSTSNSNDKGSLTTRVSTKNNTSTEAPTTSSTISISHTTSILEGANAAGDYNCSPQNPCSKGEGDCNRDQDCGIGLFCGKNNCLGQFGYTPQGSWKDDCCTDHLNYCNPRDNFPTSRQTCCSPDSPCLAGHGDCDSDNDCGSGLRCGIDNCKTFHTDAGARDDCCEILF